MRWLSAATPSFSTRTVWTARYSLQASRTTVLCCWRSYCCCWRSLGSLMILAIVLFSAAAGVLVVSGVQLSSTYLLLVFPPVLGVAVVSVP